MNTNNKVGADNEAYTKGATYTFCMSSGRGEKVTYLGLNRQGMHKFLFDGGHVWTGYSAPVY